MDWSSFTTRKVMLGAGAVAIVTGGWIACQWLTIARENYGTMVTGIGALYATFCGANTLQDHIFKNKQQPESEEYYEDVEVAELPPPRSPGKP